MQNYRNRSTDAAEILNFATKHTISIQIADAFMENDSNPTHIDILQKYLFVIKLCFKHFDGLK